MLATLVACDTLGAVLLPLNWRLAAPELARIAAPCRRRPPAGHARAGAAGADVLRAGHAAAAARPRACEPGDLLLVYTSGTTGEPKGAMHTAAGMQANVAAAIAVQGLDAQSRVLSVLPLFHVGGLCIQTLPALAAGGAGAAARRASTPAPGSTTWPPGGRRRRCWCRR